MPQLVPGGEHRNAGSAGDRHPRLPHRGEEPHPGGRDADAGFEERRPLADLGALRGDAVSGFQRGRVPPGRRPHHEIAVANGVFHHDRGVGPLRDRGAGHHGGRLSGTYRNPRHGARRNLIHDPQPSAVREAGRPDGVAVNRRAVEGRQVAIREHILSQHPSPSLPERDRLGGQAASAPENPAERFLDRNQGRLGSPRVRR